MGAHSYAAGRRIGSSRGFRIGLAAALTAAGVAIPLAVAETPAHAAAPVPFACTDPTMFYSDGVVGADATGTALFVAPQSSTAFTELFPPQGSFGYNAIAFNPADHLIYAQSTSRNGQGFPELLQIDSAGTITDLGPVAVPEGSVVATFDGAGNYVTLPQGNVIDIVNVQTRAVSSRTLSQAVPTADFTYLAGYIWAAESGTANVARIDPATGVVTVFPVAGMPALSTSGAAWTYANGDIAVNDNQTNDVYRVSVANPASASPVLSLVGQFQAPPFAGGVDGTSCITPSSLSIVKSGPATVLPGSPVTYTLTVSNTGAGNSAGYTVSDVVPGAVSGVATTTPGCTVAGQAVTCTSGGLEAGAATTITITGTATSVQRTTFTNTATVTPGSLDTDSGHRSSSVTTTVATIAQSCRATGLRLLAISHGVANPRLTPCVTATSTPITLNVSIPGTLSVGVTSAHSTTAHTTLGAAAQTQVATVTLTLAGHKLVLTGLQAQASSALTSDCAHAAVSGLSQIVSLTLDGRAMTVSSAPLTLNLGIAVIYLNQVTRSGNTVTVRSLFVDLPGTAADVVVGEAIAGSACS